MPYRLVETEAWTRAVQKLNQNARVSLPYALHRIRDNPHEQFRRRFRSDGSAVDWGATGLLIAYEIREPDAVRLLDVEDIKKPHRW